MGVVLSRQEWSWFCGMVPGNVPGNGSSKWVLGYRSCTLEISFSWFCGNWLEVVGECLEIRGKFWF